MRFSISLLPLIFVLITPLTGDEVWVRGAATVLEASGGVTIETSANGASYDTFDQPVYFSGTFSSRAASGGYIVIHTSNRMTFAFKGEGFFSIERFDSLLRADTDGEGGFAEKESRVILNLRRGELMIDSRSLSEGSSLLVETPFGRISGVKAVLQIRIEYDYRSSIYDFTISCAEGTVRLVDLGKQTYSIYAGQRIAGAGSYETPTIEVVSQTDHVREKFDNFFETLDGQSIANVNQTKLREKTKVIPHMTNETAPMLPAKNSAVDLKRPRVIEFAPRQASISPFRGEVKPPSDYQADIF